MASSPELLNASLDRGLGYFDPDLQRRPIKLDHGSLVQLLPDGILQTPPSCCFSLSLPRPLKKGGDIEIVYRDYGMFQREQSGSRRTTAATQA